MTNGETDQLPASPTTLTTLTIHTTHTAIQRTPADAAGVGGWCSCNGRRVM